MSSNTESDRSSTESATGTPKFTPTNPHVYRHTQMVGFPRPAWATISSHLEEADATIEHATAMVVRDTFLGSDDVVNLSLSVLDAMDVAEDGTVLVERSEPTVRFDEGSLSLAASARMARSLVQLVADAIGDDNPWGAAGAKSVLDALDSFVTVVEDATGRAATEERAR
jgi:hypothetical protein